MPQEANESASETVLPERAEMYHRTVLDLQRDWTDSFVYLRSYCKILSKRRWTILSVAIVVTTLAAIYSFKQKPVYRATAELEVDSEVPELQSVDNLFRTVSTDPTFLQTQVDVLKSGNLAWQTIQQLKLDLEPSFTSVLPGGGAGDEGLSPARRARLIAAFKKSLHIDLVPGSRMIQVSFESTDPNLAAEAANALVSNYREYNFHSRYDATREASGYMREQLDELKAKVEQSQQALVNYERANSIVDATGKVNVEEQRLADLSQDLTAAQNDLAQEESLYLLVKSNPEKVGMLAQDRLLQNMDEKYADLKAAYADALARYGPKFPEVIRLGHQINEIQSLIKQYRTLAVERIVHNYQAAFGRVKLLSASVAREKMEVGKLNQLMIQHNLLKHEFETNQALYDNLLTKVKDAAVSSGLRASNVRLVDRAFAPPQPIRPKKARNIAVGLMVGLVLGTTLAFLNEALDTSIKTAEDIERSIAEPVLSVIPSAGVVGRSSLWSVGGRNLAAGRGAAEWALLKHPTSALAESYHTLRTAVLLSSAPCPPRVILVTSTQPFEGKTSTSINLAMGLTQIGKRVLFIDADLRQSSLRRMINTNGRPGLSSILTGTAASEAALCQVKDLPNLRFLPAGQQPPNPADLLASSSMKELMTTLRERFDHVVVDTPPVLMVTDATVLSSFVDGVILVTESHVTSRAALARTHRILEDAGAKILGCVLNKVDLRYDGYYGSNYRYYARYYSPPSSGRGFSARRVHRSFRHRDTFKTYGSGEISASRSGASGEIA